MDMIETFQRSLKKYLIKKTRKMISRKKMYKRTDGWRGYYQPVDAVAGANNTGSWSDSPCPENICLKELGMVKKILRKNGIRYMTQWCSTSNVFCVHGYINVAEEDRIKALRLILPLIEECRLLYLCTYPGEEVQL